MRRTVEGGDWEDYLRASVVPREIVDRLVEGRGWTRFDAELGYVNQNAVIDWGIDGTRTIETYGSEGARTSFMYVGRRPRVSCYGESFTQCQQVSDGETWEEYLAGHLGEPVANYGVGGSGVYQAYRRMRREEARQGGSALVVLGLAGYSGQRSVLRAIWPSVYASWHGLDTGLPIFHGNFWPHLELDLGTGRFLERENPLTTTESLRRMSDPEWMRRALRDDLALRLSAVADGRVGDLDISRTTRLAEILGASFDARPEAARSEAARLGGLLGQAATEHVLDRVDDLVRRRGQRLLVVLNAVLGGADPGSVYDATRRHLAARGIPFFDMNEVHRREFADSRLAFDDYLAGYFVGDRHIWGHYNPRGNHLFAYAIKDVVIELLGPKPLPYRPGPSDGGDPSVYRLLRLATERPALHPGTAEMLAAVDRLGSVLRALDAGFAEPWDVGRMAAVARLSRSALHRRFAETLRMTPMEYLKRLRLDEAALRLVQTDATLDTIAADVGFANRFHLSREFTRRFGLTPSEYRRSPADGAGR